ncbi:putative protein phosphatase 2C 12 [Hibiscus syriacus]|uniref:Integrase catalytic domain-containing protein n=1 Tax=Hibiscus syriacus TaxID=106335 RepID=A0A6A2YVA8_HIBSY|nr:putative protein phosphatase 2C 12 [Hibiscus syriacus]
MFTTSSPTPEITSNPENFSGSAAQSEAVKTADGSLSKIEGHGTVILNGQIVLENVLFVPNLACNLVSALNSKKMIDKASFDIWGPSRVKNADNCVFTQFYNMVLTQFGSKIQLFKSDNGSEFFAKSLGAFFREKGIVQISSCVDTPQQNGIAERKNRHLLEGETWKDFQPHQVSPPTLHSQPSELPPILSLPTDLSHVTTPIDPPVVPITTSPIPTLNTLPENTPTPIQNIPQTTPIKQLRFYTRKRKHIPEAVLQSDACRELDLGPAAEIEEEISKSTSLTLDDFPIAIRKGVRQCTKHPIEKFAGYNLLMPSFQAFTANLDKEQYNSNGSIQRYKARLVARGFTQTFGIDFTETFAPVAKLNTVRLEEEVYMKLPPGLKSVEGNNKMCKLNKSLYGLKQSPRAWFERFTKVILKNGYKQSLADHTLFIKITSTNKKAILIVYVDDIILTRDDEEEICNLKKLLNKEFETKDLGKLRYFLGMEMARSKEGLVINQRKYVLDLLKKTGFLGCKPIDTPMEANLKFNKEDGSLVDKEKFQRLIGKLIYLSLTRPDITFPVNVISQHMTNPTEEHMAAANRILKYLKKTLGHGLMFKKTQDRTVKIFTDSSWAGDLTERRFTSGYCTFVWGNLTTWRSKKQSFVSRSSAEAEFRALALGICEGIWLLKLLKELVTNQEHHFEVLCDNQSAIQIAKNPVQHDRTKHVEIDRHFIADQAATRRDLASNMHLGVMVFNGQQLVMNGYMCRSLWSAPCDKAPLGMETLREKMSSAGGRMIISSDGVWDALSAVEALDCCRRMPTDVAAAQIVKEALKADGLRDDTTCIVIDILPPEKPAPPPIPQKKLIKRIMSLFHKKPSESSSHSDKKYKEPDEVEELFEEGSAILSKRLDTKYPVCNIFQLFMCAICQLELKPGEGISVHADSSTSVKLRLWDGPFPCSSCQVKKEAMEGKRPSGDRAVKVTSQASPITLACYGLYQSFLEVVINGEDGAFLLQWLPSNFLLEGMELSVHLQSRIQMNLYSQSKDQC